MMDIIIRQALPADLETVLDILEEGAQWLASRGINQWPPGSFRVEHHQMIVDRLNQGEVFLAEQNGEAVGTFGLQWSDKPTWGDMPDDAGYIHSLAVRRAFAGVNLGRQLLLWSENMAASMGKCYLRLDCMASNAVLRSYYEQAGFAHRGDVEDEGWKASLYEKQITPDSGGMA